MAAVAMSVCSRVRGVAAVFTVAGLLAALLFAGCRVGPTPRAPRGVVILDIDTARADAFSCYGNPRGTTPAVDALAERGVRFEWAFSQAPYTLPSQVSIMTSLYPWSHGVIHENDRMSNEATTVAELFRAAGFRTGAFVDGGYVSGHFGFDQGFEEFFDGDRGGLARSGPLVEEWLRKRAGDRFFLLIHTYDPHTPYRPPEPERSRFAALVPPPSDGFEPSTEVLEAIRASQWQPPLRRLDARDLAYARALYDGEIAAVDRWIARLMSLLTELGRREDTIVAVVSDHGEEFQEHGSLLHEKLYATVTRVPMIIVGPGVGRRVVKSQVDTVDLVPSLLELAGIAVPKTFQGRSLRSEMDGMPNGRSRVGLAHSRFWGQQRAIVDADFHLIVTLEDGRTELFRYRDDPLEQRELSASEADVRRRLVHELNRRAALLEAIRPASERAPFPFEIDRSLRALGYLN